MSSLPGRKRTFRDPVHGDIDFGYRKNDKFQQLIESILNTRSFQRLRNIRQNGLANFVFHGAEHSRFSHSMGVAYVVSRMFDAIVNNSQIENKSELDRQTTILAALLHDVGHGPFSHTLEEIVPKDTGGDEGGEGGFDHEVMTVRILEKGNSEIAQLLDNYDPQISELIIQFIDQTRRVSPRWYHQLVSSQLDADRLDYLVRDALMAGIRTQFDLDRLIAALGYENNSIVVDARAHDVLEAYLLSLDQMYQTVYFHKTVRAANILLKFTLMRALDLAKESTAQKNILFPENNHPNPLWRIFEEGHRIDLELYSKLDESLVWSHIAMWEDSDDRTLALHAKNLQRRLLPRTVELDGTITEVVEIHKKATDIWRENEPDKDPKYYIAIDDPSRVSYKRLQQESLLKLIQPDGAIVLVDDNDRSIASTVAKKMYFPRLIIPQELRNWLESGGVI